MRITKAKAVHHRANVLQAAARLFRERGTDVAVAEITRAAGLTHGGFYNHFASKDALLGEASAAALDEQSAGVRQALARPEGREAYIRRYLSDDQIAAPGSGCAIAAIGGEIARQSPEVRAAFASGLRRYLDNFAATNGRSLDVGLPGRSQGIADVAAMVGAMIMARAVAGVDDALKDEILASVTTEMTRRSGGL